MNFFLFLFLLASLPATAIFTQITADKVSKSLTHSAKFKLTIIEKSKSGERRKIYLLYDKKFSIYEKPFHASSYQEHLFTIHKFNSSALLKEIEKLRLDTLSKLYKNECIDSESGYDYEVTLIKKSKATSIKLQHYYKWEIDSLFILLNKHLPQEFQIKYLSKDNQQDCFVQHNLMIKTISNYKFP